MLGHKLERHAFVSRFNIGHATSLVSGPAIVSLALPRRSKIASTLRSSRICQRKLMRRFEELKRLDKKTRNKLRAILSNGDLNAITSLAQLRGKLGKDQSDAFEVILNSPVPLKAVRTSTPFPKAPPFVDTLQAHRNMGLDELLTVIEVSVVTHQERLSRLADSLIKIDSLYAAGDTAACRDSIAEAIETDGWSHALLRRIILIRENLPKGNEKDDRIEELVQQAGIKGVAVASLIHTYSLDQNILTIKRSILTFVLRHHQPLYPDDLTYSSAICRICAGSRELPVGSRKMLAARCHHSGEIQFTFSGWTTIRRWRELSDLRPS